MQHRTVPMQYVIYVANETQFQVRLGILRHITFHLIRQTWKTAPKSKKITSKNNVLLNIRIKKLEECTNSHVKENFPTFGEKNIRIKDQHQ